jgi:UDP-glucose 4-epimerase
MSSNESAGIVRNRGEAGQGVRSVAIAGAQTFLGRNLLRLIEEDDRIRRVVVIDGEPPQVAGSKTRSYAVDRTQPNASARIAEILAAESIEAFVHLGFLEQPVRSAAWAHEYESVGTLNVLNACREQRIKKLVLGSSTLLYGPHFDNPHFLRETSPLRGVFGAAFAREQAGACVNVLRFAPLLGPTIESYVTRWLSRGLVPTLLGYDPLLQFVHEADAVFALKQALDRDVPGVFNIVGDGVLPASTVVKLVGRSALPLPHFLARRLTALLWLAGASEVPAQMLRFLRHLCVADGEKAKRELGFMPSYTTREAVLAFGAALRLREARLLTEAYV